MPEIATAGELKAAAAGDGVTTAGGFAAWLVRDNEWFGPPHLLGREGVEAALNQAEELYVAEPEQVTRKVQPPNLPRPVEANGATSRSEAVLGFGVLIALAAVVGFVAWKLVTQAGSSTIRSWILTFGILALGIVIAVAARRAQPASFVGPAVVMLVTFGLIAAVNRSPGPPDNPSECAAHYAYAGHAGRYQKCIDRWHEYVESSR